MFLAGSPFDIFKPVHTLWWAVFGESLTWLLNFIYAHLSTLSFVAWIGAYGVAIIVATLVIRALLAPLLQFQLVTSRRAMVEQRKLGPQVAELRKKYKKDPQRLNTETMKLYQEHGINPLGQFVGCLPMVVQMPVLIALYYVFTNFSRGAHVASHFLFVPNLNVNPLQEPMFNVLGFGIPALAYLVFPLLAALTTFVQSKMMQMPSPPNPTEQELQTMQMQRTMVMVSPLMIGVFALNVPAGLGLYWFVGNLVSIIQQSFVVGWGSLFGRAKLPVAPPASPTGKLGANGQKGPSGALPPSAKKQQKSKAESRRKESEGT